VDIIPAYFMLLFMADLKVCATRTRTPGSEAADEHRLSLSKPTYIRATFDTFGQAAKDGPFWQTPCWLSLSKPTHTRAVFDTFGQEAKAGPFWQTPCWLSLSKPIHTTLPSTPSVRQP
jgi:hypothetical protein